MGTITARKRKDGSVGYTAQIRIKRAGKILHNEAETFDRRDSARDWLRKREGELHKPGGLDDALRPDPTLATIIRQYLAELEAVKKVGRTKKATLLQIAADELGKLRASTISSVELVAHVKRRVERDGVKLQTANNDIAILGAVFSVAQAAWGYPLRYEEMRNTHAVMEKLGLKKRPDERTRRPSVEEMDTIMRHFIDASRRRKWMVPMAKIVAFAAFSTRRQEEIIRIRWDDLDEARQRVLVRAMKHPRKKATNDTWCQLPPEAMAIIQSMPRTDDRIFPFTTDAVSANFTRAMDWLEIDDLTFHDLRHDGVSRLFEMGDGIPQVAAVSGHRDWNSLRRYTHLAGAGDKYAGAWWLPKVIAQEWDAPRQLKRKKKSPAA